MAELARTSSAPTPSCGCTEDRKCIACGSSHDIPGIGFNIDGEDWHVHTCPWCGVDFEARRKADEASNA